MLRRGLTAGSALVAAAAFAAPAFAVDGAGGTATITATVASGERSVTSVSPVALAAVAGTNTLSGAVGVVVTEASRTGTNPWSVTASSTALTSGANTIPASALSLSGRTVTQVGGGGTAAGITGTQALDVARTLFSVTGQDTGLVYTGTYTGAATMTLTVPNGAATGAYTGTMTVTLVQ